MLDVKARGGVERVAAPVGRVLVKLGVPAMAVTVLGVTLTLAGSVLLAVGWLFAGALVAGVGSLLDIFDGLLARLTGTASRRGALVDTVADRVGEAAVWVGLIVFLGDDALQVTLAAVALAGSMMIPFVRSKAEAWGVAGSGGLLGRAERMLITLTGAGLAQFWRVLLHPMLWVMAIGTWLTAGQRLRRAWVELRDD